MPVIFRTGPPGSCPGGPALAAAGEALHDPDRRRVAPAEELR